MNYEPLASDTAHAAEVRAAHESFNAIIAESELKLQAARDRILLANAAAERIGLHVTSGSGNFDYRLQPGSSEPFLQSAKVPTVKRAIEI